MLLPLGSWPKNPHLKELGMINYAQMQKGLEAMCYAVLPNLPPEAGGPWKMEDIEKFVTQVNADMQKKDSFRLRLLCGLGPQARVVIKLVRLLLGVFTLQLGKCLRKPDLRYWTAELRSQVS